MEEAVVTALKADLQAAEIVLPRSVFITPHNTFAPSGTPYPAIGIKDGGSKESDLPGGYVNLIFNVDLTSWLYLTFTGDELMLGESGMFNFLKMVQDRVVGNKLGIKAIHRARIIKNNPTRLFPRENENWMVIKTTTVEYDIEYKRGSV